MSSASRNLLCGRRKVPRAATVHLSDVIKDGYALAARVMRIGWPGNDPTVSAGPRRIAYGWGEEAAMELGMDIDSIKAQIGRIERQKRALEQISALQHAKLSAARGAALDRQLARCADPVCLARHAFKVAGDRYRPDYG